MNKMDPNNEEKGIIDELHELRKSMVDIQVLLMKSTEEQRKAAQGTKEKDEKDDGELKY